MDAPRPGPGRLALAAVLLSATAAAANSSDHRHHRRRRRRCGRHSPARRHRDADRPRRAPGAHHRGRRRLRERRSLRRRLRRHGVPAGLRNSRESGFAGGGRHREPPARPPPRPTARNRDRRGRGAPDLRAEHRLAADAPAAVEDHERDLGGRQPAGSLRPGGRLLRLRRLVGERRHAGLPGDDQRRADRHHDRRVPERHVGLLERRQGEPLRRPDEPRRSRGLAGDGRHRLALRRGAGRHVQLPDRRSGGRAVLHGVDDAGRVPGPALLHAGRYRADLRRPTPAPGSPRPARERPTGWRVRRSTSASTSR